MTTKKSAFALSMDALISQDADATGSGVQHIPLVEIREDPDQPRDDLDKPAALAALAELAETIKDRGVLQPITLKPQDAVTGLYTIRYGHRRFRASGMAGLTAIPAIITEDNGSTLDQKFDQVIENELRSPLTTMQMAAFVVECLNAGMKPADIARRIQRPASQVTYLSQIADLPEALASVASLGARTLAELNSAYKLDPEATVAFIAAREEPEAITQVAARTFAQSLKAPAGDAAKEEPASPELVTPPAAAAPSGPVEPPVVADMPPPEDRPSSPPKTPPAPSPAPSGEVVPFAQAKGSGAGSAAVAGIMQKAKHDAQREIDGFVMEGATEDALRRLFKIAKSDTGQSAKVARFLMAWWNAPDLGGFDLADLFSIDRTIALDLSCVFAFLASRPAAVYADNLGLKAEMELVLRTHRPELFNDN